MLVVLLFTILLVMLGAQSNSTRTLAQERKLSFRGADARMAARNALNEAAYHFITRANSPMLSEAFARDGEFDLYDLLRGMEAESDKVLYEVPAAVTRKLLRRQRISVGKVQVGIFPLSGGGVGPSRVTTTIVTRPPGWPAPAGLMPASGTAGTAGTSPAGGGVPPGAPTGSPPGTPPGWGGRPGSSPPSRACDIRVIQFQPQIRLEGVVDMKVITRAEGPRTDVSREVMVRKGFQVMQITGDGQLSVVRLSPNDVATWVRREVRRHDAE